MTTYIWSTEITNAYIWIPNPTSITLDKSSISLTTVWQTEQLTAILTPTPCDQSITWNSSDTTIATVSTTGLVTCVTPWECTITATTVNGLTATCSVDDNQWWQPWVNTVAYYPLNSTDTLSDKSWNSYDLTNSGSVAFWTQQWVDCAWFTSWGSSSWSRWLYRTTGSIMNFWNSDYTFLVWLYKWSETMYYNPRIIWRYWNNWSVFTYASRERISVADSTTYWITVDSWNWFLFTCVYDHTNNTWEYYKNWAYENTQTVSWPASYNNSWIVLWTRDSLWAWYWDKWSWGMSEIIIENVKWTSSDISSYYNQNKTLYGLS